ncbi:collagen alpha-1(XIII) chain-like [Trichomycterus rosablanca]|uniref:collagen alpha-1(XIII) chain-like n=1 Tax=Trichomycterus rosablanca TaxID=2290929 RepID=UPI002F360DF3
MEVDRKVSGGGRTCVEHQCKSSARVRWTDACGAALLCVALCCLSLGFCVMVYVRTSELQDRVFSLEKHREPHQSVFLEQLEPVLLKRLDQMLEEKLASRLPKTREIRDVSHACLCPPGPPVSTIDLFLC